MKSIPFKIAFIIGVLLSLTFDALAYRSGWSPSNVAPSDLKPIIDVKFATADKPFLQTFINFSIVYKSSELLCIIGGYIFAVRSMKPCGSPFGGLDFLVLLTAGGCQMLNNFWVMSIVGMNDHLAENGLEFAKGYGVGFLNTSCSAGD